MPAAPLPPRRRGTCAWPSVGIASLLLAIALTSGAPPAAANHLGSIRPAGLPLNETVAVPLNNWTAYELDVTSRDRILYDARVMSGSNIDFYVVSSGGLTRYTDDTSFIFTAYESFEDIYSVNGLFTEVTGKIFFLVDNTDVWGVDPMGNVTVRVRIAREPPPPFPAIVFATCALGLGGAVAVGVGLTLRHRRKRLQAEREKAEALQRLAQVRPPQSPGGPLWPPPPPPPEY